MEQWHSAQTAHHKDTHDATSTRTAPSRAGRLASPPDCPAEVVMDGRGPLQSRMYTTGLQPWSNFQHTGRGLVRTGPDASITDGDGLEDNIGNSRTRPL